MFEQVQVLEEQISDFFQAGFAANQDIEDG